MFEKEIREVLFFEYKSPIKAVQLGKHSSYAIVTPEVVIEQSLPSGKGNYKTINSEELDGSFYHDAAALLRQIAKEWSGRVEYIENLATALSNHHQLHYKAERK